MVKSKTLEQAQALLKEVEMINITLRKTDKSPFYQARFSLEGKKYEKSTGEKDKVKARAKAKDIVYSLLAKTKYPKNIGSHNFSEAYERREIEGISTPSSRHLIETKIPPLCSYKSKVFSLLPDIFE